MADEKRKEITEFEHEFEFTPLFDKEKKSKSCVCCRKEHIYSYRSDPSWNDITWEMIRKLMDIGDEYQNRTIRITVTLMKWVTRAKE